jgi:hypothetical protein
MIRKMRMEGLFSCHGWLAAGLVAATLAAQGPVHRAATTAHTDAFSTESGGFLLAIPGVADDFVPYADGQLVERPDGTARLSVHVRRLSSFDREFALHLELSGRLQPNDPGHPPLGSPVTTLLPGAYVPAGPADPSAFVYYTQATGTLTGIHSYTGAIVQAIAATPIQIGVGANNKNVLTGLAGDLSLSVVQPPLLLPFAPTGPAQLRATLQPTLAHCATHVDPDPTFGNGAVRHGLVMPGVASDYVFLPVGGWTENTNGTANLQGLLRRQNDYSDQWQCDLQLGGRLDPGNPLHPPAPGPDLQLAAAAYANQGGPIDPATWRYYTQATGTLTGLGANAGGLLQLTATRSVQVGLGAGQGNLYFGAMARLAAAITTQPTSRTLQITGDLDLRTNLGTACLLPPPQVLAGTVQTLPNVTDQPAIYTGIDLGWIEQAAIGSTIVASPDSRRWFLGNLQIRDHQTVEVNLPQGLPIGTYPVRLLDRSSASAQMTLHLQSPTVPTLGTERTILTGETQHWLVHQGNLQGPVLTYVSLSSSPLPSVLPGQIQLGIGNQFQDLLLFTGLLHDFGTGLLLVTIPAMPPVFVGTRMYCQAAMIELTSANILPLRTSNIRFTDY